MTTPSDPGRTPPAPMLEILRFLPDVLAMFARVVRDPRVPPIAKVQATALVALGLSPVDAVPVLGAMTVVATIGLAARQIVHHTSEDVLREHWRGSDEGFRVLMVVVEVGLRPRRMLWRLARGR